MKIGYAAFGFINLGGAVQIVGALFIIDWNIVWTSLIMIFIKLVCRVPLRMTDQMYQIGDFAIHGEESYIFEYYNRNYRRIAENEYQKKITNKGVEQVRASREIERENNGIIIGKDSGNGGSSNNISPVKEEKN